LRRRLARGGGGGGGEGEGESDGGVQNAAAEAKKRASEHTARLLAAAPLSLFVFRVPNPFHYFIVYVFFEYNVRVQLTFAHLFYFLFTYVHMRMNEVLCRPGI
jgi:hypothetical protein